VRILKAVAEAMEPAILGAHRARETAVLWLSGYREATVGRGMSMTAEAGEIMRALSMHTFM
jgi:hypothetical protein